MAVTDQSAAGSTFDAFVSYTRADEAWAHALAENLTRLGSHCFLDAWEIAAGDSLVKKLDDGIARTKTGVIVISKASQASRWVAAEYEAMMKRQVDGKQRVIAVVIEDVELPPLLDRLVYVDFRNLGADPAAYTAKVTELHRAIEGEAPKQRPDVGGAIAPPLGDGVRMSGPIDRTLKISATTATLLDGDNAVAETTWEWTAADRGALQSLERERRRPGGFESIVRKNDDGDRASTSSLHGQLLTFGKRLGARLAAGEVGVAIAAAVADARGRGATLRLGLRVTDDAPAKVPWETLVVPGMADPLVLDRSVDVYRQPIAGTSVVTAVAAPLRILVCIASPDDDNRQHKLLDIERELALILNAVDDVRNDAYVRVLNGGTAAEISTALHEQRFHVLHVSCHAGPGVVVLENDDGSRHPVTAQQFANDVLPPNRRPRVIVLAGCATYQTQSVAPAGEAAGQPDADAAAALTGFAAELTGQGVTGVIAMSATVTDDYASNFCAHLYRHLATTEEPSVVRAVATARQKVEADRQSNERVGDAEWATPVLTTHQPTGRLYDPDAPAEDISTAPGVSLDPSIPLRAVDEFVGRRKELREIRRALKTRSEGVVIRGIGGVGKSTLAAKVLQQLADDIGLVVPVVGATGPDGILQTLGKQINALRPSVPEGVREVLGFLASELRRDEVDWQDRLEAFVTTFLNQLGASVTLLVDNFEDNLHEVDGGWEVTNDGLAGFLAAWAVSGERSRLIVTSRYRFELPGRAHDRLVDVHLGPLSFAETRKLLWRLDGLDALSNADKFAAWRMVGGHPRTLEFLDALLRGEAEFDDVRHKLEAHGGLLTEDGVAFDVAAAEAITLSATDTVLGDLVAHIDATAGAKDLLMAASVFRRPVSELGLVWHQGVEREGYAAAIAAVQAIDTDALPDLSDVDNLDPAQLDALMPVLATYRQLTEGPRQANADHEAALAALLDAGLITTIDGRYVVHRWTASALAKIVPGAVPQAHHDAADYYEWRVTTMPQDREADLGDLEEARFHAHAAGDLARAFDLHGALVLRLDTLGYYQHELALLEEALTWTEDPSHRAPALHHIGIIAQQRGDYATAQTRYEQALTINEELGNRSGMANSYGQIGNVAYLRGDYDTAQTRYEQSLTIEEELGNRAGMANSYHNIGVIAQERGDYATAQTRYEQALTINEELGNRAGMANSYHQIGRIAQERGDYATAQTRYEQALTINEELGNRAGMATCCHNIGIIAQLRGDYATAQTRYEQALTINEELGNRAGMANSYHQIGRIAQERGDYDTAQTRYEQSLTIEEELGNRAHMATSISQIANLQRERGDAAGAVPAHLKALSIRSEIGAADAIENLNVLQQIRIELGADDFMLVLQEHADAASAGVVIDLLDSLPLHHRTTDIAAISRPPAPQSIRRRLSAIWRRR